MPELARNCPEKKKISLNSTIINYQEFLIYCDSDLLVCLEVVLLQAAVQHLGGQVALRTHPTVGRDVQAVALRHVPEHVIRSFSKKVWQVGVRL